MAEKRRGLGRGLGALIPSAPTGDARPVDVFFPGAPTAPAPTPDAADTVEPTRTEQGNAEPDATVPEAAAPDTAERTREDGGTPAPAYPGEEDAGRTAEATDLRSVPGPPSANGSSDGATTDGTGPSSTATPSLTEAPGRDGLAGTGAAASDARRGGSPDDGELVPVPGAHFAEIPITAIRPNPRQPRSVFDEDALAELVGSIREIGVLQPVVVRPLGESTADGPAYELIMGERRLRASEQAGLVRIPAIVRETDDADLLRDALLENLHRSQLNALEEAAAYQQLLDDFGCTHDELARRIHRSRPQISNTLRLLKLPPLVQRRVAAGVLSAGHARALLGLPDAAAMERLAQRIVAEGLSVRATEEIVTLGGDPERPEPVRRPRAGDRNAALDDLAARLSDRFETRVKIALGKSKGRLTVEFASVQDLNRILESLSPDDPGLLR